MRKLLPVTLALLAVPGGTATASGGGGGASGELHLVDMDELSVPIIDGDRADGMLEFKLVLEARNDEAAQKLKETTPMLRSVALSTGIEFARLYASPMMPLDARHLATEMTRALQAQDAGITRVLLVEVMASRT